jgi:CRISPR-associated endonuclease/helicase Cas3
MTSFTKFFRSATRSELAPKGWDPYPFQARFAETDGWYHLVRAPTAAGKTATAILGWLWRWHTKKPQTPRRLVYCLPMRVLVEQSLREAAGWIANLELDIPICPLMGGVEAKPWHLYPDRPAILIGTQDMLLSRALNRGYAASRFHWPIDFGLLNNDCLWVFDEPQLMATGVSTSAQMAGLRESFATFGSCPSVWMSATLEPGWLDTVDFKGRFSTPPLELTDDDYDPGKPLFERMTAKKTLHPLGVPSSKEMKEVAKAVLEKHVPDTQTLVIVNTVDRAKAVYAAIQSLRKKLPSPPPLLIHSRYRPRERERLNEQLKDRGDASKDRIVVATQVVEAGVDISARTLITELAPWASFVQRVGRCNRTGADGPGQVFWIDLEEKFSPPYALADLEFSREHLQKLKGRNVSPKDFDDFKAKQKITLPFEHKHVLRRRDILDLFDTTPDLSGNDIDIQRFVRSDDADVDAYVFWRDVPQEGPPKDEPSPERHELCSVPVGQVRAFVDSLDGKNRGGAYVWDHLEGRWVEAEARALRPGLTILLTTRAGGYSELGWDGTSKEPVVPLPPKEDSFEEGVASDPNSAISTALTIAEHTEHVCAEICELFNSMAALPTQWKALLTQAARWHDAGKGHAEFQSTLQRANPKLAADQTWAKSGTKVRLDHKRPHLRHELASGLAALQHDLPFAVAYLTAAHHGRVRLGIRPMPDEEGPCDPNIPFALGIHHGDELPDVDLGGNERCPSTQLDLSPMHLGGERSWTAAALRLLAELGPFRLAYL